MISVYMIGYMYIYDCICYIVNLTAHFVCFVLNLKISALINDVDND